MSMWIAGRNLRIQIYHQGMHFITSWTLKVSVIKITNMQIKFGVWNRITYEWENVTLGDCYKVYLAADVLCIWDLPKFTLEAMQIRPSTFLHSIWISMASTIKDNWVHLLWIWSKGWRLWAISSELFRDIDMLLMFGKGIQGRGNDPKTLAHGFAWEKVDDLTPEKHRAG